MGGQLVPEAPLKPVHVYLGVQARISSGWAGGCKGKMELASFLEQKLWFMGR